MGGRSPRRNTKTRPLPGWRLTLSGCSEALRVPREALSGSGPALSAVCPALSGGQRVLPAIRQALSNFADALRA